MKLDKLIKFEYFIVPAVVMVFTYLMTFAAIIVGALNISQGLVGVGIQKIVFVPIFLRVIAEIIIVMFQNNAELKKLNASRQEESAA